MIRELEALRAREACKLVATMSGGADPRTDFGKRVGVGGRWPGTYYFVMKE
jgi:hypothetical protein